ncbi:MAG: DUF4097 family beta strand repeat-containing protein [Kangiellaceae bacterium]|nr:DUF4097 family beta strand repeat-containing protein [Kangiellaceae bacterium]MCW8998609.1 DUF4097 family beta strand repeat-containing protein [Kangiellaceae bacterium]
MKTTNNLKKAGLLSIAVMGLSIGSASAEVNETIEKTWDFDSDGRIQVENVNGDVTFRSCDCAEVSMTAHIYASSQEMRDRISIDISDSSSSLRVKTKYKNNRGSSWNHERSEVTYTFTVPNSVRLDGIELVNGNLNIEGVTGQLDADLVNGELKSDGLTASTKVSMVNGDMELKFSELSDARSINLNSVNGNIYLYLPSSANASIDAETVSGRISNDFGIEVIKHKYVGSEMRGSIGNGDVQIDLENVNGKIAVRSL